MSMQLMSKLGVLLTLVLLGCKPAESPPDVLKTQREALDKAKALDRQMQQQLQDRMRTNDDEQTK